ncbi:MAG: DUF1189 family protein [Candidatus Moraniibacteriota bacterium]
MKQFFKQFFQTVRKSIYDPEWYGEVPERPLSKGIKYLLSLTVFVVLAQAVVMTLIAVPFLSTIHSNVKAFHQQLIASFPDELVITQTNGEVHTNMTEPYAIPLPESWKENFSSKDQSNKLPGNLVVFETNKSIERQDFFDTDALVLIGKNEIGIYNADQEKVEIRSFGGKFTDGVLLDKTTYETSVNKVWGWLKIVLPIVLIVLVPLMMGVVFIGKLVYLLFGALVVWLGAKMVDKKLTYKQAFKASLYLITLPMLLGIALDIPFLTTVLLLVLAILNFRAPRGEEPQEVVSKIDEEKPIILPEAVIVEEIK